jgi:hypothetical protein
MSEPMERPKVVRVRAYVRWRLRRLEAVCSHWRSRPVQLHLNFG